MGLTIARSDLRLSATPGYWTFTAYCLLSSSALCTWPMEAPETALVVKESKISLGRLPSSLVKVLTTSGYVSGGAL